MRILIATLLLAITISGIAQAQVGERLTIPNRNMSVPVVVEDGDKSERLLITLDTAPVIVDLEITIDGLSFRSFVENAIDEIMDNGDLDDDGKISWFEVLDNTQFFGGRYRARAATPASLKTYARSLDLDKDGAASEAEIRAAFAVYGGGPSFMVMASNRGYSVGAISLRGLLDADKDGMLSKTEIESAAQQLKKRDSNDNDLIEANEIISVYGAATASGGRYLRVSTSAASIVHHIDSQSDKQLYDVLKAKYGESSKMTAERFSGVKNLVETIDANQNGVIDEDEVAGLRDLPAHLIVEMNLGQNGDLPRGALLRQKSDDFLVKDFAVSKTGRQVILETDSVILQLAAGDTSMYTSRVDDQTARTFQNYDKDKNGYLEEKEMQSAGLKMQFKTWDSDRDGKVFEDELKAFNQATVGGQWNRVSVAGAVLGGALFGMVDSNGDTNISARELHHAAKKLQSADKNNDGAIEPSEVPTTVRIAVSRGGYAYSFLNDQQRSRFTRNYANVNTNGQDSGPAWFAHSDRNLDGDVSRREFLGDDSQFKMLDANEDGFIELEEAKEYEQRKGR